MAPVTCIACKNSTVNGVKAPGNPAKPEMGHFMYFTNTGRIAACVVKRGRLAKPPLH